MRRLVIALVTGAFAVFFLGAMVPASATGLSLAQGDDSSASLYDGAAHSVPTHTSEAAPIASHEVSEGVQEVVAAAVGPQSVVFRLSVAAKGGSATYAGAWDATTGEVTAGGSIKNVPGLGHGVCAEAVCVSNLEALGSRLENIAFTEAIGWRRNVWQSIPVCEICQSAYRQEQFAPGVVPKDGGPWTKAQ